VEGARVQDIERPAHVERLSQPARARRPRAQVKPSRCVPSSEHPDGIVGNRRRRRDIGQKSSVRSPESQLAVGLSFHLIPLLVDGAVMAPTEHREVRERGGSAVSPVTDVMTLAERPPAARKAATTVAVMQRAPQRWGNGSRPRADFHDVSVRVVPHHHPARVARQAARRFL
jgi:hypothetical protein